VVSNFEGQWVSNQRHDEVIKELERSKSDFFYFCSMYLRIINRDFRPKNVGEFEELTISQDEVPLLAKKPEAWITLKPNAAQKAVIKSIECNPVTYVLKHRRGGISTIWKAWVFWRVLFEPGAAGATICHLEESSREMFSEVRRWYEELPPYFKAGPLKLRTDRANVMEFEHGGQYRVGTPDTFRGGKTLTYRHYSEFSAYERPEEAISAVEGGSSTFGVALYETTARGLGYAHDCWRTPNGWSKLFFPWTQDRKYRRDRWPAAVPKTLREDTDFRKYCDTHNLDDGQINWLGGKLHAFGTNWAQFNQEYPATAELAFIASKGRVFTVGFPDAKITRGRMQYLQPDDYRAYTLGADPAAGGAEGDFSAYVVLDVTFPDKPMIAATYYGKPTVPEFAELVLAEAKRYSALIVPDRKGIGLDLVNRLLDHGYPSIWRDVLRDRVGDQATDRIGYDINVRTRSILTNKLIEFINGGKIEIVDERLQYEINDFHYNDDRRPEHLPGCHDDILFALAMAMVGSSQKHARERTHFRARPVTFDQVRIFRKVTGRLESECQFDDDDGLLDRADHGIASVWDELDGYGASRVLGALNAA